ncbi:hypothetical protein BJX62DRAFT_225061 [Aspergillus germanicus]
MLEKCKSTDCSPFVRKHDWLRSRRAAYPFKKETLVTLAQTVSGLQDNLSLALQLLNSALINQQQKQLRDIFSRTLSIDSRTTSILDVVKQEKKTTSDLPLPRRGQYGGNYAIIPSSTQAHSTTCAAQELINNGWKRQRQRMRGGSIDTMLRYCACSRRPLASSSFSVSFFALHEAHCPLYEAGKHTVGAFSVSPIVEVHGVVGGYSAAFELVLDAMECIKSKKGPKELDAFKIDLGKLFREKMAAPTDRLADGSTILHVNDVESIRRLVLDVIEAGVPANERTVHGKTAFDIFIQAGSLYVHKFQNRTGSIGIKLLLDLLISGSYMSSLGWASTTFIRALLISSCVLDFDLSNIDMAILVRSIEALRPCLLVKQNRAPTTDINVSDFGTFLLMCLGWAPGILLLLRSTLSRSSEAYRGLESALLILDYMDKITDEHLEAAARCGDRKVLETIIYELSTRRHQLQEVALQQLPVNAIRSLALPVDGLLDTKAFDVQKALEQHNISVEPRLQTDWGSLYSAIGYGGTTAADILYAAGFTDLNQCALSGCRPLACVGYANSLGEFLDLACWMIGKGADLHQQSATGYPVIFGLAYSLEDPLTRQYLLSDDEGFESFYLELKFTIQSLQVDGARLLQTILSDSTTDNCSCACSNNGCSAESRLLKRLCLYRNFYPLRHPKGWIVLILQDSLSERFLERPNRASVSATIRCLTFESMRLTHTCHVQLFDGPIEVEEAQEIREEEAELIDQLEDLVV